MSNNQEEVLNLPPFPPLKSDGYSWEGKIVLNAWAGFQAREGAYTSVSDSAPSTGQVSINISPVEGQPTPTNEQAVAFQYLLDNQVAIRDAILQALFDDYPAMQEKYEDDDFGEDEADKALPDITAPEDFKPFIGLGTLHILNVFKDGAAYIGFEFGCTWDDEHGLGAMTHQGRVLQTGDADAAFDEYAAEQDKVEAGS